MLRTVLAVVGAVLLAWWSWRDRLHSAVARAAGAARALGIAALLLLLLDPGIALRRATTRPIVLLDRSISMFAAGGHATEAARRAATLGDTVAFGTLASGQPGGSSNLRDALASALETGRPVTVVTDGEITDASDIAPDLLASATVAVLPRSVPPDIALIAVRAPLRLAEGDTLAVDIDALRTARGPDSAVVSVRDSGTVLLHGVVHFSGARASMTLRGVLPKRLRGERWLQITRDGAPDGEPEDDVRWWRVRITPTPGVVVLAATPDFDARALYRTLKDVVGVPARGYVQLQRGQWRRMDDLRTVSTAEVVAAARHADLLAVRGDSMPWRDDARARLLWPAGTAAGDWYLDGAHASPVAGAFAGVDQDSLPSLPVIAPLSTDSAHGWVGVSARASRRGTPIPVVTGRADATGRTVTFGADGLYRWGFRGGEADQVWRTLVADAAAWLLASSEPDSALARLDAPVVQRGRPVRFEWSGDGPPVSLAIHVVSNGASRTDTLRFDPTGHASLALPVGRYHYVLDGGGAGTFGVEPYSDELLPAPATLRSHAGSGASAPPRRSLRELLGLFALAIAGFAAEWLLRRRLGMK